MDILTIHHLCYYLEEIGIIDQTSLPPFLSLYSFALNKNKENENISKKPQNIFENVLCAYLKKIFSVEKNYKIFSNKIISKFKQHFILKQYNGITLLFAILRKNLNSSKIQSYYKIQKIYNNPKTNSSFQDDSPFIENKYISKHTKKKSFDSFRFKYMNMKKSKLKDDSNNNRSDIFNKSVDFIKYRPRNTIQSLNNRNNSQLVNLKGKNIQLEFKKRQFLSKIKREHTVKFKRSNSQTMVKNKNNSSASHNKSELFRDFSTSRISSIMNKNRKNNIAMKNNFKKEYTLNPNDFHYYKNFINEYYNSTNNNNYENNDYFDDQKNNLNYDDNNGNDFDGRNYENEKEAIPNQSNYSNNINLTAFNNFDYDIKKDYVPNSVKGEFSFKSKYGNFNPFNYPTFTNNKMNTISNYKMSSNNYMGHIIKKDFNNSMKNQNKQNVLTPKDIHRIKEKLEKLNYFNFNS